MRSIAHHDNRQQPQRMKFLRIIFGCPEGARKWRILCFAMLLHSKTALRILSQYGGLLFTLDIQHHRQTSLSTVLDPFLFVHFSTLDSLLFCIFIIAQKRPNCKLGCSTRKEQSVQILLSQTNVHKMCYDSKVGAALAAPTLQTVKKASQSLPTVVGK